ncbi:metal ABC transporter solute-binding protein, Zn/Mn family [Halogeometricum sp. CBA1124]|uniref:metal ABC transporter solute-binding protein, Zn/Mn family n=1 Tax=Halogeometricum sp. CBA1124 TaxID=2668071 RepID=UPI00142ACCCE|nr:zinc ABC transporter substrate-binding protein [Halogeometricum sp. CBA1124]MUV57157.1 zinc ABC transporter substrate-binding protein [Halogeometricum sp. CBA1124]
MRQTRRNVLLGTAAVAMGSVTGCLGTSDAGSVPEDDGGTIQASFFVVSDFADHVAADADVRNLVPFGQHGHGWEPGPDVQRDVFDADAFVYVGDGFQPWADKIVQNVRNDGADVNIIEAWHGVDLLDASGDHDAHGADEHDHEESPTETHDDHDHGAKDPHFWLDPSRAKQSVRTIANGLAERDPANESTYAENADAYAERLDSLDDTYAERLSGRTRDTVLVAGHNSFRYLAHRYDFHVEALTGLAPDAEPTPKDVRRAQSVVDEHDVEYVLAPVFESDRAATQLVRETDAKEALPLTPVPTLTEEWNEKGWGYLDVMEQVNLRSLERALGVE